ncbi:MAG TPA: 2-phospho-L-lactate transferase, partial [Chloroflexota bacterium]|nr:2-phospho-L-lactate transferase [Chloroflexota bacterium]
SPDLDTVLYTLAGIANPETGWGILEDSFNLLEQLGRLGQPDWFRLGDRDLATHITRTHLLQDGASMTEVTRRLAGALGVQANLLPMCDERVETIVHTPDGELAFQDYFVRRHCQDTVLGLRFQGMEQATIPAAVREAVASAEAIVFCPSNPLVSIGPILSIPGMRALLRDRGIPIIAVSPIIAGEAVRGPAASMLSDLGHDVSVVGVARQYEDLRPILFIDEADRDLASAVAETGARPVVAPTLMRTIADRRALARLVLAEAAPRLVGSGSAP